MHVLFGCLQFIESAHRWGPAGARKDPDRSAWQPQHQTAHATFMLTFYLSGFSPLMAPAHRPPALCKVLGPHTGVSPLTLSLHSNPTQPHAASFSFNKCQHATSSSAGEGERNMICFRERRMEKMTSLWRKRGCVCVSDFEMVEEIIISNHTCYANAVTPLTVVSHSFIFSPLP